MLKERAHDVESLIVAPSSHGANEAYEHNGLRVRRYLTASDSKFMLNEVCDGVLRGSALHPSTVLATERRVPNFNGRSGGRSRSRRESASHRVWQSSQTYVA
jgi:hypothetical protein